MKTQTDKKTNITGHYNDGVLAIEGNSCKKAFQFYFSARNKTNYLEK